MRLLWATLLLIFLSPLLRAAPAPLPRANRHPEPGGWSKVVGGLRVRLIATRTDYRVGDTVRLTLEIQNVTTSSVTIEEPHLAREVTTPERTSGGAAVT